MSKRKNGTMPEKPKSQPRSKDAAEDRFGVTYKDASHNIYSFLNNHPGGINYVEPYREKDVTTRMRDTQHSPAAYYLLREYADGGRANAGDKEDDLEKLVDWDEPMLHQVGALGERYGEWVRSPVDRRLRLFKSDLLENLTITPWYVVPLVWLPVVACLLAVGVRRYAELTGNTSPMGPTVLHVALGVLLWTLLEYSLHRWIFHMEPSGKSQLMIYLHFAIHGLHHKVPFDTRRLVFPPVPAAVIMITLYKIISYLVPESALLLLLAGGILGYVVYDMIHFYLHYGAPSENSYFYHLKRYHNQHHFAEQDSGFGISSVFWDKIFGTAISLRRLNLGIRW